MDTALPLHGYDDEIEFNTQCSSQWDSLCHYHHQPTSAAYNGFKTNAEKLTQSFGEEDKEQLIPTLNHWHSRGGVVARGVLIDYKAYADKKNIKYSAFESHRITTEDIEAVAKEQGVSFRQGDVFIIRSGFTEALTGMSSKEQDKALGTHRTCGVQGNKATAKWFWDHHFAAVAGDAIAFEALPPILEDEGGQEGQIHQLVLHQYFLALMGMPIGELWDLKALSEQCAKTGRYTFLLTSSPLNVPGSVGSPPNALAIF